MRTWVKAYIFMEWVSEAGWATVDTSDWTNLNKFGPLLNSSILRQSCGTQSCGSYCSYRTRMRPPSGTLRVSSDTKRSYTFLRNLWTYITYDAYRNFDFEKRRKQNNSGGFRTWNARIPIFLAKNGATKCFPKHRLISFLVLWFRRRQTRNISYDPMPANSYSIEFGLNSVLRMLNKCWNV